MMRARAPLSDARRRLLRAALASLGAGMAPRAFAQAATPLRIVVPFPPGGGTDVLARIFADRLRAQYPGGIVVENRVGASGRLGVEAVRNAEPDGMTLLFVPDFLLTVYPHSFRKLAYDPLRDFAPVSIVARSSLALSAGPGLPESVKTVNEYVAWAKANPKQAFYATTSAGGTPHFVGVMLARAAGVTLTPVHYKGGAPAIQDLLGGQVPVSVNPVGEIMPYARAGRVRVLATTGGRRSKFLPDAPTLVESGYPDIVVEPWLGFLAPARTPADRVDRLSSAIADAAKVPEVVEAIEKIGNEVVIVPPDAFQKVLREDIARWQPIVQASGFTAEE
jgi:tripartite-type tricarboxylate transporter receptor subunit TctC